MGSNAKRHAAISWILLGVSAVCNGTALWMGPGELGLDCSIVAATTGICAFIESIRCLRAKDWD